VSIKFRRSNTPTLTIENNTGKPDYGNIHAFRTCGYPNTTKSLYIIKWYTTDKGEGSNRLSG